AWVADLMAHRPAVRRGRAYWSVSPCLGTGRRTAGGIPVGFDDDTAYLGRSERFVANRLLAVPSSVARLPDVAAFRYATLLHLVRAWDLALMSIWNPTFLSTLLAQLDPWQERLCSDIRAGTVSLPEAATQAGRFRPDARRALRLESILRAEAPMAEKLRRIWPRLALISCWADGPAAWGVPEVRSLFPSVEIQPKGLIATEAFVSFPLVGRPGAALALRSHFFEFQEVPSGALRLAHELERGGRYRVVVTTGGGLYRYELRDEIKVVGFDDRCPLLRFLGKADCVSDLVGEKLGEPHVRRVLDRIFSSAGLSPGFALLVPVEDKPPRYRLYLEGLPGQSQPGVVASLERLLEDGLEENPYYRYAVSLGQLAPVEVAPLDGTQEPGRVVYERRCVALGQKLGDVKPAALDPRPGWAEAFGAAAGVKRRPPIKTHHAPFS
ncbi:MAG: GH3 auxin-responsive promoter family protein, partial [Planctomycetota bacterium]